MTLTRDCVDWAFSAVDRIPRSRLERTRVLVADSFAIGLAAGGRSDVARRTIESLTEGAGGTCRILGTRRTAPPVQAAFANAALAHALDFDDTHDRARIHTTTVLLPAAMAVAEDTDVGGDRVLRAVTIGAELMCRWALSALADPRSRAGSWYLTQLLGGIGAAVTAGLVYGLDEEESVRAVGHAVDQASGAKASSKEGDGRSVYPGYAVAQGVSAVLLARGGLRGASDALEGESGLWRTHLGVEAPGRFHLPGPDEEWESDDVVVKPWPGCRAGHPYIDAVRRLPEEILRDPEGIEGVTVAVDSVGARLCRPLSRRRRPRTLAEAGFSVPFMVALALAREGTVDLRTMTGLALGDPLVLSLADRIVPDHRLSDGSGYARAEAVVVHRGRELCVTGSSSPEPGPVERRAKFSSCLEHGGWGHHEEELRDAIEGFDAAPARNLFDTIEEFERSSAHHVNL